MTTDLITITDAAKLLSRSRSATYALIRNGDLPAQRIADRLYVERRDVIALQQYASVPKVAAELGLSSSLIYRRLREGRAPVRRLAGRWYIQQSDIAKLA